MPLSKLWLFLLSFMCGLVVLVLLSMGPELRRREVDQETQRLLSAQAVAQQVLANQAHKLLAAAVQMGSDAVLQSSLNEMGRGQSELPLLHDTAQAQLRQLNRDFGAALLLCVDARGRVLARVGHDEAVYRDPLDGFPLIEAALRGYRLDDLWLLDGVLYRVAASPVVALGHDRYVGAIVVGQVVGSEVINLLSRLTGVQGVLLADGKIIASGVSGEPVDAQKLLAARTLGNSVAASPIGTAPAPVVRGPQPGPERLLTFVDMPGEASQQGAMLVLVAEVLGAQALPGLVRDTLFHLKPMQGALGLFGAVAMLYVIGLAILRAERAQLYRRMMRPPPASSRTSSTPTPTAAPPPPPAVRKSLPDVGAIAAVSGGASAHSAETVVAGPMIWEPEPELPSSHDEHVPPPLPERSADMLRSAVAKHAVPPPLPEHSADMLQNTVAELPPPSSNFEPTFAAAPPAAAQAGAEPDGSFYQVFQEYVLAREKCRESVEGISYEQFRQRLSDSRAQIMQQHGCRGVDFHVYIKEGKAALRATPLWK